MPTTLKTRFKSGARPQRIRPEKLLRSGKAKTGKKVMRRLIFVVDDETIIADTLCAILRCSGYDAQAFYDAETTLPACEYQRPDFVISDVSMPGMNGVAMAMQIKGRFPACGVLLVSGHAGTVDFLESAREQGYDFELLTKPVSPKDLLAKIEISIRRPVESAAYLRDSDTMAI
jgi:FixJ family two-component response regulator